MTLLDAFMTVKQMTDRELAKLVGRERSTITKIRRGQATPSLEVALKIAEISKGEVPPTSYAKPIQKRHRQLTGTAA